jgi:hypothetical protein
METCVSQPPTQDLFVPIDMFYREKLHFLLSVLLMYIKKKQKAQKTSFNKHQSSLGSNVRASSFIKLVKYKFSSSNCVREIVAKTNLKFYEFLKER